MAFLTMIPAPGERVARFVGDRLSLSLRPAGGGPHPGGWRALLRTNLGRAAARRQEIILAHFQKVPLAGASWHDIPMTWEGGQWTVELALPEPGYFRAKAYALDPRGWQHWVEGPDVGVSVHPDAYRTGNTIYCAFPRWFGAAKAGRAAREEKLQAQLARLDR
jgi:hypothetical protein